MEKNIEHKKNTEQMEEEGLKDAGMGSAAEGDGDPVRELALALERAKAEAAEKHDLYVRKTAEFENYRRRRDREFEELIRTSNGELISHLLPVLENLERALNHSGSGEGFDAYCKGVEMIVNQFKEVLRRQGLEPIESVGQPFDPNLHEALLQTPSQAHEPGVVCEEIERGYRLGDRVIRHAKVAVSLGAPEQKGEATDAQVHKR
ncbi:MAG: nucleotide exchange factor GrpE [Candidatus Latescibacteria bacterium]|nr:nucleotide exchange factor GrpE [Candidatus Latescibacterota bacterium]